MDGDEESYSLLKLHGHVRLPKQLYTFEAGHFKTIRYERTNNRKNLNIIE